MRYLFLPILLVVAATGSAMAQGCCPTPCAPPSCAPKCSPVSSPAALGMGPAGPLQTLCGCDFDKTYIKGMYQLHANIATLATAGAEQSCDSELRYLSARIRNEQFDANAKLASWYKEYAFGNMVPLDFTHLGSVVGTLTTYSGNDFNMQYARELIELLEQAKQADQLAIAQSTRPDIRCLARVEIDSAQSEIAALRKWAGDPCVSPAQITTPCPAATCPAPACPR